MKNIKPIFLYLLILVTSCNKLEVKPKQSLVVPATVKDFQGILDNSNIFNQNYSYLPEISSGDFYIDQELYDNLYFIQEKRAYTWEQSTFSGIASELDWEAPYQKVFYCNIVLDGVDKLRSSVDGATVNNLKGQALVHRASAFYAVAQEFASPYSQGNAQTDLGIPLRLSSDFNIPTKRSTLEESYRRIISDLNEAKNILPITSQFKTRPSKASALGLLARVYLSKSDYNNALICADSALLLYNKLIDYNDVDASVSFPFGQMNDETTLFITFNTGVSMEDVSIDSALYKMYDDDDLRKDLYFKRRSDNTCGFRGSYTGGYAPYFCGIATDELYLIKAECLARMSKSDQALQDLNTLLSKRYKRGRYSAFASNSEEIILEKILQERRKELVIRGQRWSDLRRLNQEPKYAVTLSRVVNAKRYDLPPNDLRYIFQIPEYVIKANGIAQNP